MADKVAASHILLMYKGSMRSSASRSQEDAKAEIARLEAELNNGGDFATLARDYSDCPSKTKGGDLGSFGHGQMVPAFEEAAFGLPVGGTSGIVETPFGYHLIKRTA